MKRVSARAAIILLLAAHAAVLLAGFFAPYDYAEQNRDLPYAPPSRLRFIDQSGKFHLRPFVHAWRLNSRGDYEEDQSNTGPIRFFVHGSRYQVMGGFSHGLTSDLHLFGSTPGMKLFLIGSDAYGRDQFSRLLFGGRISLLSGLLAACVSLSLGTALGAIAGMGGWIDEIVMRIAEIFLVVPAFYLLLAMRALLPLKTGPEQVFVILVTIIGITGWARPARIVRGVVLSVKKRDFVAAARGFGATELYLFRRHILPHVSGVVLTQAAVLIPQYVLAEVTLSFVGLGVNEPIPSWGNMLTPLEQYAVLDSYWWMFAPAFAAIPVALAYYILSLEYGAEEDAAMSRSNGLLA